MTLKVWRLVGGSPTSFIVYCLSSIFICLCELLDTWISPRGWIKYLSIHSFINFLLQGFNLVFTWRRLRAWSCSAAPPGGSWRRPSPWAGQRPSRSPPRWMGFQSVCLAADRWEALPSCGEPGSQSDSLVVWGWRAEAFVVEGHREMNRPKCRMHFCNVTLDSLSPPQ